MILVIFFFTVILFFNGLANAELILYFPFDEGSGDTLTDESGGGYEGVIQGGVEWTDGKYGKALSFDGSSGYVEVADDDGIDLDESYTVMTWVYPTLVDGSYRWIIDKGHDNDTLNYLLGISAENVFRFITSNLANDIKLGDSITAESWYHIAGVQDTENNEVLLYVNGSVAGNVELAGEAVINDASLRIGCREWQGNIEQFFGGIVDEVAIFNTALTETEVQESMQGIESPVTAVNPSRSIIITWSKIKTEY